MEIQLNADNTQKPKTDLDYASNADDQKLHVESVAVLIVRKDCANGTGINKEKEDRSLNRLLR